MPAVEAMQWHDDVIKLGERRETQMLKFNPPPKHTYFAMPIL